MRTSLSRAAYQTWKEKLAATASAHNSPQGPHVASGLEATCYPNSSDYETGSLLSTGRTQTSLVYGSNQGAGTVDRGWWVFNTSSIPVGATITNVELHAYCVDQYYPYWAITRVTSTDPRTSPTSDVYADLDYADNNGESPTYYYYSYSDASSGWNTIDLGTDANTDLQGKLSAGWWACGLTDFDNYYYYFVEFDGWNEPNKPYIVVTYLQPVPNDVGVAAVLTPSGVYTKDTTVYPEVKLANFGTDAQSGFPVTVWIDAGGSRVYNATQTFSGTLAPGETAHFALTTPFTVNYPVCRVTAFTDLSGDQHQYNDTAFGSCYAADFTQDFETNGGGLQASPDTGGWAWGTPAGGSRPAAHSGTHVWGDLLTGSYRGSARDSLRMGPFTATIDTPMVGWWSSYQTYPGYDGYALYFSTDNGSSWTMTHAEPGLGRGYDMTINADYDSAYSGDHSGWEQMFHKIPVPNGGSFMLMWVLRAYPYYPWMDGVLIDDVSGFGFERPARDLACTKVITPSGVYTKGTTVYPEVKLANFGTDAQSGFPVTVWIDAGGTRVYDATQTFSGTLAPGETADFALSTSFTVNYSLCRVTAFTSLSGDQGPANDTAFGSCLAADFIQDFETYNANIQASPDTGGWAWGTPTGGSRPAAHSGSHVWGDLLTGSYRGSARDSLRMGPFTATIDNPVVGWWSSYQTYPGYDGYALYFSTDNGSSWTMTHAVPGLGRGYDYWIYADYDSAYSGSHSGWEQMFHKIPVSSGGSFMLMWELRSYPYSPWMDGVLIDDVAGFGFERPARDLACTKVITPSGVYTKGTTVYPEVKLANLGSDAQSGFPVTVWIDAGGTRVYNATQNYSGTLAPGDTTDFTLSSAFTVNYSMCQVTGFTDLSGDQYRGDDTAFGSCLGADFIQNFETSDGGLQPSPASGGWAWGTPTGGSRPAPHSGTHVWGDVLTGSYRDGARDSLRMGPFKATTDNPLVGWWSSYQTQPGVDGYSLYYSTNGSSWTMTHAAPGLGRGYDGTNWADYDSAYTGSHSGWEQMFHTIPVSSGSSFMLMWVLRTYQFAPGMDGVLIDDVAGFGFERPARDLACTKAITPSGVYTKGTTVYPEVKLRNFGTDAQSGFPVTVWIDAGGTRVYNATQTYTGTLAPGETAHFALTTSFTVNYPLCHVTAFTDLSGDQYRADDTAFGTCLVADFIQDFETYNTNMQARPDSGGWAWGAPTGGGRPAAHSGTHVWGDVLSGYYGIWARDSLQMGPFKATVDNPVVGWWSSYQTLADADGYALYFSTDSGSSWTMTHAVPGLGRGYDRTIMGDYPAAYDSAYSGDHSSWEQMLHQIPVLSGGSFMLRWVLRTGGWWYDYKIGVLIDDVAGYGFVPPALDAGVSKILAPSGMVGLDPIAPKAVIRNYGTQSKPFNVTFSINCTPPYTKTVNVTVPPLSYDTVVFPNWTPKEGYFTARCQTFLTGDENPGNDWKTLDFSAIPCGWSARAMMPTLPSGKAEGAGGWLAYNKGDGLIYAAKGENTSDFYSYNLHTNTWTNLPPIPKGRENTLPGDGCRGVADGGDNIYMTKGANTLGFWQYTISTQTWTQLPDVPAGRCGVQAGSDLKWGSPSSYIPVLSLLKGHDGEVWNYSPEYGLWSQYPDAPTGSDSTWADGSWLVFNGSQYLYVHKAQTREMYRIGYPDWQWTAQSGMPLISRYEHSKLPLGIGGCATWRDSTIYALKGSNTSQFWRYLPHGDSWTELDTVPQGSSPKRVHTGGDITATTDFLFAFKGSKTNELWLYRPRPESSFFAREGVQANPAATPLELALSVAPNPVRLGTSIHYAVPAATNVSLKLYNVTGALAKTVSNGQVKAGRYTVSLSAKGLARGVYILKMESDAGNLTRKVVIE